MITPHMFPHYIHIGFVKSMKWQAYMRFLMTDFHFRSDARQTEQRSIFQSCPS